MIGEKVSPYPLIIMYNQFLVFLSRCEVNSSRESMHDVSQICRVHSQNNVPYDLLLKLNWTALSLIEGHFWKICCLSSFSLDFCHLGGKLGQGKSHVLVWKRDTPSPPFAPDLEVLDAVVGRLIMDIFIAFPPRKKPEISKSQGNIYLYFLLSSNFTDQKNF